MVSAQVIRSVYTFKLLSCLQISFSERPGFWQGGVNLPLLEFLGMSVVAQLSSREKSRAGTVHKGPLIHPKGIESIKMGLPVFCKPNFILVLEISSFALWKAKSVVSSIHLNFRDGVFRDNLEWE